MVEAKKNGILYPVKPSLTRRPGFREAMSDLCIINTPSIDEVVFDQKLASMRAKAALNSQYRSILDELIKSASLPQIDYSR